jgi:hypothetical protein
MGLNTKNIYMNKSIEKLDLTPYDNNDILWCNYIRFTNIKELIVNTTVLGSDDYAIWKLSKFPVGQVGLQQDRFKQGDMMKSEVAYFHQVITLKIVYTRKIDLSPYSSRTNPFCINLGNLSNIKNIKELILENFSYPDGPIIHPQINILSGIQILKKLKQLIFINASNVIQYIYQYEELCEYCKSNNIKLIFINVKIDN